MALFKEKSINEILQTLTEHFDPKSSVIVQQFRFHSRSCQGDESVAKFTAELQQLSEHCEFGSVLNDRIQQRLLAE